MQTLSANDYKMYCSIISLSQKSLRKTLAEYLKKKYDKVYHTKEFIIAEGNIPIALLAHMDTVFKMPPKDIYYDRDKNVIWSPEGGCGDDRAGVFAILKILQSNLRPTVIFTTDEEMGGLGADAILKQFPECPISDLRYMIQLDRRGTNDCVFYDCDNDDFVDYVEKFGFIENFGTFTDISILCPQWGMAGVNLSIGYENEHSVSETVHVSAMLATIAKVKNMLREKEIPSFKYVHSLSSYKWFKYLYPTDYESDGIYLHCHSCNKVFSEYELFPVKMLDNTTAFFCPDCMVDDKIQWCVECGEAFETDATHLSKCRDCQGGKPCNTMVSNSSSTK